MDGNLTTLVWQLLSSETNLTISQVFLTAVLVFFTAVLAIFTRKLYHATSRYANLVGDQNDMMQENQDHELLVKKYNRMLDEMKYLIAPLAARMHDPQIFALKEFDSKIKYITAPHLIEDPINRDFYEFWEKIYENLYLNQSGIVFNCLVLYISSINDYKKLEREEHKMIFKSESQANGELDKIRTQLKEAYHTFEVNKQLLTNAIQMRHMELKRQIDEIEKELNISGFLS